MTTESHDPRRGTRDNGLRCPGYTAVADLDPRVVDVLLATLRDAGIAAYAEPTPAATSFSMEARLPTTPTDRLWVDNTQLDAARGIVETEKDAHQPERIENIDFEVAWQQVLTSLRGTPSSTDLSPAEEVLEPDADDLDEEELTDPADDAHYEPPPPPPLPRLRSVTFAALASIAFGLVILASNLDGGGFTFLAIIAILAGVASLIWNMRQGPPTDSGWDDGAVV